MIHMTCDICGKEILRNKTMKGFMDQCNAERRNDYMHIHCARKDGTGLWADHVCSDCMDAVMALVASRKKEENHEPIRD